MTWNDDHPPGTAAPRGHRRPPARRFRLLPALLQRRGPGRHQRRRERREDAAWR
jgi:hypothetical protein